MDIRTGKAANGQEVFTGKAWSVVLAEAVEGGVLLLIPRRPGACAWLIVRSEGFRVL